MSEVIVLIGAFIAFVCAVITTVPKLVDIVDKALSIDAKKKLTSFLLSQKEAGNFHNWVLVFTHLFDSVFGKHHFSAFCFKRSCIVSLSSVLLWTIIWTILNPSQVLVLVEGKGLFFFLIWLVTFACTFNLVVDYISLLETRYILFLISKQKNNAFIGLLLIVDLLYSALLYIVTTSIKLSILYLLVYPEFKSEIIQIDMWQEAWLEMVSLTQSGEVPSLGIFFYTTFTTSILLWLCVLSGWILRIWHYLRSRYTRFLLPNLNIVEQPIHAISVAIMLTLILAIPVGAIGIIIIWPLPSDLTTLVISLFVASTVTIAIILRQPKVRRIAQRRYRNKPFKNYWFNQKVRPGSMITFLPIGYVIIGFLYAVAIASYGQTEGQRTYYMTGGVKYVGEAKEGMPNGWGTMYFQNGDKHVGYFIDGIPNGDGASIKADSSKDIGNFRNGALHGLGQRFIAGNLKVEGYFKNGIPDSLMIWHLGPNVTLFEKTAFPERRILSYMGAELRGEICFDDNTFKGDIILMDSTVHVVERYQDMDSLLRGIQLYKHWLEDME